MIKVAVWGFFVVGFLLNNSATAQVLTPSRTNVHYDEYYSINQNPALQSQAALQTPWQVVQNLGQAAMLVSEIKVQVYNLLSFIQHNESFGDTLEPYNRKKHFGTWIKDPSGQTCYNTRGLVLVRESQNAVVNTSSGCTVESGLWHEVYTDQMVESAKDLQIDHVVPLKNAYVSGADKWDYNHRCLYANFMGNRFHLLAVDGHENMKKGDSGPEGYMPPSDAYKCTYLQDWVRIKMLWDLELNPDEVAAIKNEITANHCNLNDFLYTAHDVQEQRQYMQQNADICGQN